MTSIRQIFDPRNKFQIWLDMEKLAIDFFYQQGKLSDWVYSKIKENLNIDPFEIFQGIDVSRQDYETFIKVLFNKMRFVERDWVDYAFSPSNLSDLSNAIMVRSANDYLISKIEKFKTLLKETSIKNQSKIQVGRTHGVHAEPTSFGHRFCIYYDDLHFLLNELLHLRPRLESLSVNYKGLSNPSASFGLQSYMAIKTKLNKSINPYSSKIPYARYISILHGMCNVIYRIGKDLELLNQVSEVTIEEQLLEEVSSLYESLSEYSFSSSFSHFADNRNINFSYMEKVLMNSAHTLDLMLELMECILDNLVVNTESLSENLSLTRGNIYSQTVLHYLIDRVEDKTRQEISKDLKKMSVAVSENENLNLKDKLAESKYKAFFNSGELNELFDPHYHTRNMDAIYGRVFFKVTQKATDLCEEEEINRILDGLSEQLNEKYDSGVCLVVPSREAVLFSAKLLEKFKCSSWVLYLHSYESSIPKDDPRIKDMSVLIFDYLVNHQSNVGDLVRRLKKAGASDVSACSLFKLNTVKNDQLDYFGMEVSENRSIED
ncbi:adenylosuccinate lyase / hypoxanthine phosphoribosyltransferase (fusion) [Mycoplasma haemofelis str. Langford 1]|uniref:Adenylosuccinate lyase/hypoxanthine n=2 Tax=Mycoplasma haemofelis TaxID=29501 RepID=F6FHF4_MYCHI|nr:lyase family protein [Mycoplasma haemofelis]AEG73784.1 adenylosuccinate lyase/hypoxanthine [Mycoplasma haemofelis Ohio2]CBY93489.1 adenylosuccinate lyase / hypoxanthine phosphoribosyltransferase (fusion) [Mycoplasma haemofelis str. Langford 1]